MLIIMFLQYFLGASACLKWHFSSDPCKHLIIKQSKILLIFFKYLNISQITGIFRVFFKCLPVQYRAVDNSWVASKLPSSFGTSLTPLIMIKYETNTSFVV